MTEQQLPFNNGDNTYVLDGESVVEMSRLLDQDKLMTKSMGGVFPEYQDGDLPEVSRILDIACGPGGWVLDIARTYPHIEVTGIDISKHTINYARAQAQLLNLHNAHFEVMNALKALQFSDESFDIVNMRTVVGFILPELWPSFLQECQRVLKPGGTIRITEGEWGFTNKPAVELVMLRGAQSLHRLGRSFSPNGIHIGLTPVLPLLLKKAGFLDIKKMAHTIDHSYGAEAYEVAYQDFKLLIEMARPLWIGSQAMTEEEYATLGPQALAEMQEEDFASIMYILTVWAIKP